MEKKFLVVGVVAILIIASISAVALFMLGVGNSAPVEKRANFNVTSFSINKHDVVTDIEATVTIGLKNNGTAAGDYQLNISLDNAVVNTSQIHLGVGNSTMVNYNISSSKIGNHSVSVGTNSTYLNCYDPLTVGDYLKYHITGYDVSSGSIDGNMTTQIISKNATAYTTTATYSGIGLADAVETTNISDDWSTGLENLTFVSIDSVLTHYGTKNLSHYTYTHDSGPNHFLYDLYLDVQTGVIFRIQTTIGTSTLTFDLVDSNRVWLSDV
jgi:hypothetical protein